jgi:hypothetical protein
MGRCSTDRLMGLRICSDSLTDYSWESFVVDRQSSLESRGGGEIVKT